MKIVAVVLTAAAAALADEVPLLNGKTIIGDIVETVPAVVRVKTGAGNIIDVPLTRISPEAIVNLPASVSEPYRRISDLEAANSELTAINEKLLEALRDIKDAIEQQAAARTEAGAVGADSGLKTARPTLSNLAVKEVERLLEYTRVSWKADLFNPTRDTLVKVVRVRFLDAKGFSVHEACLVDDQIVPGAKVLRQTELIPTAIWKQVKKYEMKID